MKELLEYQDLQISLSEWRINLFRYDAYVRSVVLRNLSTAQKSVLALIAGEDFETLTRKKIESLFKSIEQIIDQEYERIEKFMSQTAQEIFITSYQAEAFIYNEWLGASLFKTLPKYKLEAIKATPLFEGTPVNDWFQKQAYDLKFKLEAIVRNGALIGETEKKVAQQVRHRFGIIAHQAETLVRTANASVSNQAQESLLSFNEDLIYAKQQLSTLDSVTTPQCRFRDGMKWTAKNEPIGHKTKFMLPPLHANCRSLMVMIVDKNNKNMRASEFGVVDGKFNYESWLKTQSNDYQDKVLGKKLAQWFRDGKVDFPKMLDQNERPLTLEQLRRKYNLD